MKQPLILHSRRFFLNLSASAAGVLFFPEAVFGQNQSAMPAIAPVPAPQGVATAVAAPQAPRVRPDPLKPEMVKEFVGAAHGDLEKTKAMLEQTPTLLNATWDWGGGDFEMAIGGAGHMGRHDIAMFLISKGGRFDMFVAAMLGRLDFVKAALSIDPNLVNSKGPHGIPLMAHAKKGGDEAAEVVKFLETFNPGGGSRC